MRPAFHLFASMAGALVFGAAGAVCFALSEPVFEAGALMVVQSGAAPVDPVSLRALVASEPVLRRAALRPEAAVIVEKTARPSGFDRIAALAQSRPADVDTLTRAAAMLAPRVDLRLGPWPDTIEIIARMPTGPDAAAVATAVAEAFVAEINEIGEHARRRAAQARGVRLDQAARRVEQAQGRLQALRASDPVATAVVARAGAAPEETAPLAADAPLQAAATQAAARLAEAARIYGPRHPLRVEAETAVRRTQAALKAAHAGPRKSAGAQTAPRRETSTGGPDPRAGEIAAAEQEVARAEAGYDLELTRNGADRREARLLKPAPVPIRSTRPPGLGIIGGSALLGFLLLGVAPNFVGVGGRAPRSPPVPDRRLARLRGDVFDPAAADRLLQALGVGEGRTARIVTIAADVAADANAAARALAQAALAAGWRPLLLAQVDADEAQHGGVARPVSFGRAIYSARKIETDDGPLFVAPSARVRAPHDAHALDATLAFDLVVVDAGRGDRGARTRQSGADGACVLRVAERLSDAAAGELVVRLRVPAACYAGAILRARN